MNREELLKVAMDICPWGHSNVQDNVEQIVDAASSLIAEVDRRCSAEDESLVAQSIATTKNDIIRESPLYAAAKAYVGAPAGECATAEMYKRLASATAALEEAPNA